MVIQVDLAVVGAIITGLVGLVGGIIAVAAYFRDRKKFLQAEGASMQKISDLQGKVDVMCRENTDLKAKLASHDTDLAVIKTKVEGIENGVADLKLELKDIGTKIDTFIASMAQK